MQVFAFGDGLFFLADEPGLHFLQLAHEVVHGDDEIANDGKIAKGLDADGSGRVVGEEGGAGELRLAVHHHAATSAHAHAAAPAIGEGAVLLVLYVVERVEDDPIAAEGDFEALEMRSGVGLRGVARDFEFDGVGHGVLTCAGFLRGLSVNAFAGRPPRDPDGEILNAGASIGGAENQGVGEKFFVVALGEIGALVRSAGLGALQSGLDHGFGNVEHEGKLEGGDEVGVEGERVIVERESGEALLEMAKSFGAGGEGGFGAVDTGAGLHGGLHFFAEGGGALAAGGVAEELRFDAALLVEGLREDGIGNGFRGRGEFRGGFSGARAEDEEFGQGIGAEAIGAVDADAGDFAGGEEAGRGVAQLMSVLTPPIM